MVNVLSDIEIPESPDLCQGFTDDGYRGHLDDIVAGMLSQYLDLPDDAMTDILTNFSVPSPPTVLDNKAYSFDGQDNTMVDILMGIEIPSPP